MNTNTANPGPADGAPTGTPFIAFLPRNKTGRLGIEYQRDKLPSEQDPSKVPTEFIDAMAVRKAVYVDEQGVPLENEFDRDDARALHWVIYSSVQQIVEHEVRDIITDSIVRMSSSSFPLLIHQTKEKPFFSPGPKHGVTTTIALGTIRLVPFPHPPHPRSGGVYINGELTNAGSPASVVARPAFSGQDVSMLSTDEAQRVVYPSVWPPAVDDATELHDGQEPYVKLGRLSVLKEYRGRGIGSQLIDAAINYMRENPNIFDPLASKIGFGRVGP